jgi:molecular chaperone DnaK
MGGKPLQKSKEAAKQFIDDLLSIGTRIGLIIFADDVELQCRLTDDKNHLKKCVDAWQIDGKIGYGNMGTPFKTAREELEGQPGDQWILVLSDGVWSNQAVAVMSAKKCHALNIMVVGMGFGSADEKFLKEISNSSLGSCFTSLDNLSSNFRRIASEISSGRARIK